MFFGEPDPNRKWAAFVFSFFLLLLFLWFLLVCVSRFFCSSFFFSGGGCFVHSFQPSFFSTTDRHFLRVVGGFLERRIPGKIGEVTPRVFGRFPSKPSNMGYAYAPKKPVSVCVVCSLFLEAHVSFKRVQKQMPLSLLGKLTQSRCTVSAGALLFFPLTRAEFQNWTLCWDAIPWFMDWPGALLPQ